MAVFAHPDDETMAGPLLAHFGHAPGVRVQLVIVTNGERGVMPFHAGHDGPVDVVVTSNQPRLDVSPFVDRAAPNVSLVTGRAPLFGPREA